MKRYVQLVFFLCVCASATARDRGSAATDQPPLESLPTLAFDNKGNLTNRDELETICKQIAAKPQTVVVFMHGWHGSAAPSDHSFLSFQKALDEVRRRTFKNSGRTLTGIYLTWNARILPSILDYPIFHLNQARADAVARGEGIATAINRISHAARRNGREHFIVAGHSFGGRILGHVVGHHPELLNNVDLWLLANAADDAKACRATIGAVSDHPYQRGRLPKLVWVTSIQDWATGFAYKIADLAETQGWDRKLQSHQISINKPTRDHPSYSADVRRVSDATGVYAHNLIVKKGLKGHGDVWSEPMIQVVDYYVLHQ